MNLLARSTDQWVLKPVNGQPMEMAVNLRNTILWGVAASSLAGVLVSGIARADHPTIIAKDGLSFSAEIELESRASSSRLPQGSIGFLRDGRNVKLDSKAPSARSRIDFLKLLDIPVH
jgi:hypothetical protein